MKTSNQLTEDLRTLLSEGKVGTQEEICQALSQLGHVINQSKVSRLLRKVGAVKSKNERGEIVYRLPHEPAPPTLSDQLSSLVIDVVANETMVVVNTSPGSAQLLARVIDYHKKTLYVLATIAGDDAVLIVPQSTQQIKATITELKKLLIL